MQREKEEKALAKAKQFTNAHVDPLTMLATNMLIH